MKNDFYLVHKDILPDYIENIIRARELIENENCSVTEACKKTNISRSTYYKYKNEVYRIDSRTSKKLLMSFKVEDVKGVLNSILSFLFDAKVNVLTISQNMPVSNIAFILLTLDVKDMDITYNELLEKLASLKHVKKAEIIAYE